MKTLEDILQEYMGCKRPVTADGEINSWGMRAYNKLIDLLYDLAELTEETEVQEIIKELDEICDE